MSRKRKPAKLDAVAVAGHRRSDDSLVPPPPQRSVRWLAALLVAVFTLAAFLPTLHNQFVNWDDDVNFLDNPHYRGLGGAHLRWMWTTFHRSEEHTSELQSQSNIVCRLLPEKKNMNSTLRIE